MNQFAAVAALAACALATGLLGVLAGLRRRATPFARPAGRRTRAALATRRFSGLAGPVREQRLRRLHLAAAAATATAVYLLTAIPALSLVAGYAVLGLPLLLQSGKGAAARIAVQAALAQWTRALSVRIASGLGLEAALIASAQEAPDAIADALTALAARLEAGTQINPALAGFADQMADATADYAVVTLRRASVRRGAGLAATLDRLAAGVEARVRASERVEADRAEIRTTVRLINAIVLSMAVGLQFDNEFMTPYHTVAGQIVLVAVAAAYTAALVAMTRLTQGRPAPRLLGPSAGAAPAFEMFGRQP